MCRSAHYLGAGGRADDRAWEMHLLAAVVDFAVALAWDSRKTLSVRTRNVGMGRVCNAGKLRTIVGSVGGVLVDEKLQQKQPISRVIREWC
jgi:hypothetical protein